MNRNLGKQISIPEWYADKNIFISGATGFLGKILVEKLLRDCPDLCALYLMVRAKRGQTPEDRRKDYINHLVFKELRETMPRQLDKIKFVQGDVLEEELGICENDRNMLHEKIDIVFHCAANVRFDQPLKGAVQFNTLGTYKMLQLAENMKKLQAFVHVGTTYCQCNEEVLEERRYPAKHHPLGVAQMCNMLGEDMIEEITPKLLNGLPNTYAYTKGLTEELLWDYRDKFPIAVARPSIVFAALKKPIPGWIEGMNGPTGLAIGAARGVIRTMHCNPDYNIDAIPVDVTINGIIAIAWQRGMRADKDIFYVNLTERSNFLTWGESLDIGRENFFEYPLTFALWYPDGSLKSNYYHHLLCVIFFHYLPALLIDGLLIVLRKKPFMWRVQKKVSNGLKVLQYYTTKPWVFKTDNYAALEESLCESDKEKFYMDTSTMDWRPYLLEYTKCTRTYILNEPPETLPKARANLKRLYYLDRFVQLCVYGFILYLLWSYMDCFVNVFEYTKNAIFK
ncbi:putative fatty acyl-CoA reductase CG5065 [Culicoides brevitarsis]|uniref:putative fatty acyl-CoA reductase CG5065 n=1 Tax=Culicoides brevitarsis TaxID=469753 RepID=UPI00307C6321